ncbi:MAG: glycosyltransferase [Verrucomicrobiota bacterium]
MTNKAKPTVVIVDSHPVQYKAPVYQALQRLRPDQFAVIYGFDTTQGYSDKEFGAQLKWDSDLLAGYQNCFIESSTETSLGGFKGLPTANVVELLEQYSPLDILVGQFRYEMDLSVFRWAKKHDVRLWIRHETQDTAFDRPAWKDFLRGCFYRYVYGKLHGALYIGNLNREHLVRFGISEANLIHAPYCVPDPIATFDDAERIDRREKRRTELGVQADAITLAFFGKLIPKKHPEMLALACAQLPPEIRSKMHLVYVGTGPLLDTTKALCKELKLNASFPGFVNQSALVNDYLAADIAMLPSRRMGETWGLVVNEALQAGCGVITTDAVGSSREFAGWERFEAFPVEDVQAAAKCLEKLTSFTRDFNWCRPAIEAYSIESAAQGYAELIDRAQQA